MADGNYARLVAACDHEKPLFPTTGKPRKACYACWPGSGRRAKPKPKRAPRACDFCGRIYVPGKSYGRFCSHRCSQGSKPRQLWTLTCEECRCTYQSVSESSTFCGKTCKSAAWRASNPARARELSGRRDAWKRGAANLEHVDPMAVFRRDRWTCQLCGVRTPPRRRGTKYPDAPELDHIVPLSQGGDHTYLNTQCTCKRCNMVKGAKPLGQLLLLG